MNVSSQAIIDLIKNHIKTIQGEGAEIFNAIRATPPQFNTALKGLHKIKGSSGSIGFLTVSSTADKLHRYIEELNWNNVDVIDMRGRNLIEELERLLEELNYEDSTLINRMNAG